MRKRIIPCLLISDRRLVKTIKFKNPIYIGDPINAARIFSEKEVDELMILDIGASKEGREPDYEFIAEISGECFMPLSYGGGLTNIEQVTRLIRCGVEKVVINSASIDSKNLISESSERFGSQAIIGGVDIRKNIFGSPKVVGISATRATKLEPLEYVYSLVKAGVGEILVNNVDLDGTREGYDVDLIRSISKSTQVPVIACGGAGNVQHLIDVLDYGCAAAAAAGSMFVFHGKHNAVLISYPSNLAGYSSSTI